MITVNGQLCYSPRHPSEYGKSGMGHGQMFGYDLQLWNLMYLSLPNIDYYLIPGADPEAVYNSIPVEYTAACIAQLRGEHMMRQYPSMRHWLTLPPWFFWQNVTTLSPQKLCALPTVMNIPNWCTVTAMQANFIRDNDPSAKTILTMLKKIHKETGA